MKVKTSSRIFLNIIMKPNVYIQTKWEIVEGYRFKQPIKYCNGIELTVDVIKNFYNTFGVDFSTAYKESNAYREALMSCNYDSKLWTNNEYKNKAFNKIHEFIKSGKSGSGSTITALFPFEIYMINDGFEIVSFCEMNAINPSFSIVGDNMIGDEIINPKGVIYKRCYQKDDYFICLAFGIEMNKKKTNFYFITNKSDYTFQVNNDINLYKDAINGILEPLELIYESEPSI